MACKIRLNVVCSSRDKRFLVIAYEDWLVDDVKTCVEVVFQKLYPNEQTLKVCKLQNEFHFDLPQHYTVGDALSDAGLVFAIEQDHTSVDRDSESVPSQLPEENQTKKKKLKRKKKLKSQKKICKSKSTLENETTEMELHSTSSDNKVTSTTGSPVQSMIGDCKLMPQVVEKTLCEDTEVDVETVEDEYL